MAIDETYIDMVKPKLPHDVPIEIEFVKLPSNVRVSMPFMGVFFTFVLLLCLYMFTVVTMVLVPMVDEKQSGVKEFLRIASTYSYLNNIWHFVLNVAIGLFIFGVSLAIAASYGLTAHIATDCLIVLVVLFVISFVSFTFMVSVIFKSGRKETFLRSFRSDSMFLIYSVSGEDRGHIMLRAACSTSTMETNGILKRSV